MLISNGQIANSKTGIQDYFHCFCIISAAWWRDYTLGHMVRKERKTVLLVAKTVSPRVLFHSLSYGGGLIQGITLAGSLL